MQQSKAKLYGGRAASGVVMTIALLLCFLSSYVILGGSHSVVAMLGDVRVSVEVRDSSRVEPISYRAALQQLEGVEGVQFIGSEEAHERFSKSVGMDITEFMGEYVLPNAFVLTIAPSSRQVENLESLKNEIQKLEWVADVYYEREVPQRIEENIMMLREYALYAAVVVALCSLVIVFLGIRLSIGAEFNAHSAKQYKELARSAYRLAWIRGVVCSALAVGLLYLVVEYARIKLPGLEFSTDVIPFVAACGVVASTLCSLLFTFVALLMTRK